MKKMGGRQKMKSVNVLLNSIEKIKEFTNIVSNLDSEIDLVSGRYTVDAKSIMGIFSLDLTKNIRMDIYNDEIFDDAKEKLKDFIVQ